MKICLLGATGTIGRATLNALEARGHEIVCLARQRLGAVRGPSTIFVDFADPVSVVAADLRGFDAIISCMASRTGAPRDAWAVDYAAHVNVLAAAMEAGVPQFVLLSAICVQKPRLAFQHAKLAFEKALIESGLTYSVVRPTAFFKSLSGQVERVRRGKPFLVFGDGRLTACKPISDGDLAAYMVGCLEQPMYWNRILPIGGPGPAMTPRDQGAYLSARLGRKVRFKHVPVALLGGIAGVLGMVGLQEKAELARIGRYYATESMLVWDEGAGQYDAAATPETGRETLFGYYDRLLAGEAAVERGEHSVF